MAFVLYIIGVIMLVFALKGTLSKESSMVRDSVDLGTPSAPPIFDVPIDDGRSSPEVENQEQVGGAPGVFISENDQSDNGTCPSRESVGYDVIKEGCGNFKSDSLRTADFGERYGKRSYLTSSKLTCKF